MRPYFLALLAGAAVVAATTPSADEAFFQDLVARGFAGEERDTDDAAWEDLDSFGMMMHTRSPVPGTSLTDPQGAIAEIAKRDQLAPPQEDGLQTRDGKRLEVLIERDTEGSLKLPRSWGEAKAMAKRVAHIQARGFKRAFPAIITWYTGNDLLNPACVQHSRWHPTDNSLICALTISWAGQPKCGTFIKIKAKGSKRYVIVRHVDACGGCASGSKHIDLTLKAFKALYPLDKGLVKGLQAQQVSSPVKGKWGSSAIKLYGPKNL